MVRQVDPNAPTSTATDWFDQQGINDPNANGMLTGGFSPIPLGNGVAPANDYVNKTPTPTASANPFSSSSSSQDLINALNAAGAAPGSAQAAALTKQYTDALGNGGQALQAGFTVGQYDPTRQKIYLPGTDLKYDNGQWGGHPYSASDSSAASGSMAAPATPQPTYTLPTLADLQATPGYQFAQQQGEEGINRNAVAKGFSGGTLKDLQTFDTGLADSTYQNAVGNSLNAFGANQGANQQGFNQGLATNQFNLGQQGQYFNQGLQENENAFNQYNTNNNTTFAQQYAIAQLGNPGNPFA